MTGASSASTAMKQVCAAAAVILATVIPANGELNKFGAPENFDEFRKARAEISCLKNSTSEFTETLAKSRENAFELTVFDYDVNHYTLDLKLDPADKTVSGYVEMLFTTTLPSTGTLTLNMHEALLLDSLTGDHVASYEHVGDLVLVIFDGALPGGTQSSLRLHYHGKPAYGGFGAFGFNVHGNDDQPIIWSLSEPYFADNWWPCKDFPSDKADSADIILTVPTGLTAVSNGSLKSRYDLGDGWTRFHWFEKYPITTYLISVAVSNYETFGEYFHYGDDSMEVTYFIYPESMPTAQEELTETVQMLEVFTDLFGPYPFLDEKYGIAQFPWGGGMEHQTITSQGGFGVTLTVHELAHQWFGDKITNASWEEIWLNEGFASYAEALYFEATTGPDYYDTYMGWMDVPFSYAITVDDTTSPGRIFDNTVYDKGAWFLHMLRNIVGDEDFFTILKTYQSDSRFAYGNATTDGFQIVCETVSGMDLDYFFNAWMYQKGRPHYLLEWTSAGSDIGGYELTVRITQEQVISDGLFPMPLELLIHSSGMDTLITVFNDAAVQEFTFTMPEEITGIELDPNSKILKYSLVLTGITENRMLPTDIIVHGSYPNPFNSQTTFDLELEHAAAVSIDIFNIAGRRVSSPLSSSLLSAGRHRIIWNAGSGRGEDLSAGIYFARINSPQDRNSHSIKLIYLK